MCNKHPRHLNQKEHYWQTLLISFNVQSEYKALHRNSTVIMVCTTRICMVYWRVSDYTKASNFWLGFSFCSKSLFSACELLINCKTLPWFFLLHVVFVSLWINSIYAKNMNFVAKLPRDKMPPNHWTWLKEQVQKTNTGYSIRCVVLMQNDLSATKNNSLSHVRFVMKFVRDFDLSELNCFVVI